jgi:hypothetical protein
MSTYRHIYSFLHFIHFHILHISIHSITILILQLPHITNEMCLFTPLFTTLFTVS